jgi:hypothetical protein
MRNAHISFGALATIMLMACGQTKHGFAGKNRQSFGGIFGQKQETAATVTPESKTPAQSYAAVETHGSDAPAIKIPTQKIRLQDLREARQMAKQLSYPADSTTKSNPPIVEPITNVAFWLSIGGASGSVLFPILYAVLANSASSELLFIMANLISTLSFFALLGGLILGIISMRRIKKNPETYGGYGKALAAIIVPSVLLGLALLFILFYILLILLLFSIF